MELSRMAKYDNARERLDELINEMAELEEFIKDYETNSPWSISPDMENENEQ